MTSMQDALTEALEHPREYHPPRPRPLGKKSDMPVISALWLWSTLATCAGLAIALLIYKSRVSES